jgi:two-component system NtrC family sensor kinase
MNSNQSNNRILIIDDNPSIHNDIRKILSSAELRNASLEEAKAAVLGATPPAPQGYSFVIDSAFQGEEGYEMARRAFEMGQPYALAFVDMRMPPGWDGMETLGELWRIDPTLQVVVCTAYSDYSWGEIVREIGKSANMVILKKPFDNIEVLQLAHALAEKWRLNDQVSVQLANLDQLVRQRTSELENANEQLRREIAERTAMEQQLRQAQKMEAVGQLAAGVAHDFNNILTIILGQVSLLSESPLAGSIAESVGEIRDSAERAASLVRQLLAFSRKQVIQPSPLDLGRVITNFGEVLRRVLGEHIELRVHAAPDLPPVLADLRMIEQVIINLAVNARDAMPQGGSLTITAKDIEIDLEAPRCNAEARPGRHVCLSVADTGCGIIADVLPHIFDPFFTTKDTGKGTGLGLASAYGIIKQHSGWVEVQSEVDRGTTFLVFLPVCSEEGELDVDQPLALPITGGDETVLVVEDEPAVRRLAVKTLKRYGYRVYEAESGVQAIALFQKHRAEIDLLLTDMVMPGGLTGRDLALRLQQEKPSLKCLYMTGYSRHIAGAEFKPLEEITLLTKPFSATDLLRMIRQVLK